MCRYDTKAFDPEVTEARAARRWIVAVLRRWELQGVVDDVELAGSELTTNALLHTRSGFDVTLAAGGGAVELAVRDRDPREPIIRPARQDLRSDVEQLAAAPTISRDIPRDIPPDSERPPHAVETGAVERHPSLHVGPSGSIAAGRGLLIVDAIADEWGVAAHAAGKDVWMRIRIPSDWPYLDRCPCDDLADRTPSGHRVRHLAGAWDSASRLP